MLDVLLEGFAAALNRRIEASTPATELRDRLEGHALSIEFEGLPLTLYFRVVEARLCVQSDYTDAVDAMLRGTPLALLRMADPDATHVAGSGGVSVSGDTRIAQNFQKLLSFAKPDWEEEVARLIGDVGAHQLGGLVRGLFDWGRGTASKLGRDTAEYLQEESRDLPARAEMERYLDSVDELRASTDRLESRLQQLVKQRRAKH